MELGNFTHMGAELVVQLLMLYSTSPEGRMLAESMMTGDPFNIDVKLNDTASNRNVEILNTYLKTIGLRIVFEKVKKQKKYPVQINPINFIPGPKAFPKDPIIIYGKDTDVKLHPNHIARLNKFEKYPIKRMPITFKRPMKDVIERLRENAHKSVEDAEAERAALKEREDQQTDE